MRLGSMRAGLVGLLAATLALGLPACRTKSAEEEATKPTIELDGVRHRVTLGGDDFALGGTQPLVTVVVFSDYACPPCARTWQVMENLVEDYGEDLRVVFRAFTVPGFGRGEQAAEAVYAAGAQGKFWEMHRRLFAQGGNFDRPTLRAHAEALSLDVPRFMDELDTGAHSGNRVRHRRQAKALGVAGLPSSFVNGHFLGGFADEATWHAVIDHELAHAREMMAQGTPRAEIYSALMQSASTALVGAAPGEQKLREELAARPGASTTTRKLVAPDPSKRYAVRVGDLSAAGAADAPVEVVMFFDFRCPYCRRAWEQELGVFLRSQPEGFEVGVRQLPLPIHPEARGAALAALAAGRQGKFWAMFDKLVAHEGPLGRSDFVNYAGELGLDPKQLQADLDDPALAAQIEADAALADTVGVNGTPAFFVNGRYVSGYSPGLITNVLEQELAVAKVALDAGTPRASVVDTVMADAIPPSEFPNQ